MRHATSAAKYSTPHGHQTRDSTAQGQLSTENPSMITCAPESSSEPRPCLGCMPCTRGREVYPRARLFSSPPKVRRVRAHPARPEAAMDAAMGPAWTDAPARARGGARRQCSCGKRAIAEHTGRHNPLIHQGYSASRRDDQQAPKSADSQWLYRTIARHAGRRASALQEDTSFGGGLGARPPGRPGRQEIDRTRRPKLPQAPRGAPLPVTRLMPLPQA